MRLRILYPMLTLTALSATLVGSGPAPIGGGPTVADTTQARPMTTSEKIRAARLNIQLPGDVVQEAAALANLWYSAPDCEMRVQNPQRDKLGYRHIRMRQYYKGVPVEGTDIILHVTKDSVLYHVQGRVNGKLNMSVIARATQADATEAALKHALEHACLTGDCAEWATVDSVETAQDRRITKYREHMKPWGPPELQIINRRLVYVVRIRESGSDRGDWEYRVDATSAHVLQRHNTIDYWGTPPSNNGYDTTVAGVKLAHEVNPDTDDSVVTATGWRDTGNSDEHYFFYGKGIADSIGPWGVYDLNYHAFSDSSSCSPGGAPCVVCEADSDTCCDWEHRDTPDWGTTDRFAASVGKNMEMAQQWIGQVLGRYSFDDNGKVLRTNIRAMPPLTAGWLQFDTSIYFSEGIPDTFREWGVLDALAHEVGHGITRSTSNLYYWGEGAALNESFSDIMGVAVEFAYQPDSTSRYPGSVAGTADWLVGEDVNTGAACQAFRDLRMLYREDEGGELDDVLQGRATRYDGTRFLDDSPAGAPYRRQQGVQSFVYYLLAEGNAALDTNDGHPFGAFTGVGRTAAARIAMWANMYYTTHYMGHHEMPGVWAQAAQELVDESVVPAYAVEAVDSAWSAVDIRPQLRIVNASGMKVAQIGHEGALKLSSGYTDLDASWAQHCEMLVLHGAALDTCFGLASDSGTQCLHYANELVQADSLYLDTAALTGCLVVRDPQGKVHFAADSTGRIRTRRGAWPFSL